MNADSISVHLRLSAAYLFGGSRHARARRALSTLYRAHRRYGPLFVSRNGVDVLLFNVRQRRVSEVWIRLVPVETRKVLLQPRLFKYLAVTRVNLLSHLAGIFEEQAFEQRARDRLRAHRRYGPLFVSRNGVDVLLFNVRQRRVSEVWSRLVPVETRKVQGGSKLH